MNCNPCIIVVKYDEKMQTAKKGEVNRVQCIGICDDEVSTCCQMQSYLEQYMRMRCVLAEVKVFYTGESLCSYIASGGNISVLFLDIELPRINGVAVGKYIREKLENETMMIIYISSKTQYAMELFQCRPLDFLVKPLDYGKIQRVMDIIRKREQLPGAGFACRVNGIEKKIPLQDIFYFKSENKKVCIVKKTGEERFTGKLKEVESQVPPLLFLRIHKSYLISYQYVEEFHYEWVKMANGDILDISKAYRSLVRRQLIEYRKSEAAAGL